MFTLLLGEDIFKKYFSLLRDLKEFKIATKRLWKYLWISKKCYPPFVKDWGYIRTVIKIPLTWFTLNKIKPRSKELVFCYFSNYFGKGQTHLRDFTSLLWEWKTLILIERIFFQPTWLPCKSPYKECRNSCGTSCRVAVELPAYSVKVKVDTTKSRKQIPKSFWVLYL